MKYTSDGYYDDQNQYRKCGKCYKNNQESDQVLGILYSLVLLIIHLFFVIKLIGSRNKFAMKQRSPLLAALTIVLSFITSICLPITFVIHPNGKYNPNNYINNLKKDQWYNEIIYIRSLYAVLQSVIFWGILLRNIRIFIVFETQFQNKIIKFFFGSDLGLIIILSFKILVESLLISNQQQSYNLNVIYFNSHYETTLDFIHVVYHNYWMMKHCVQNFLLPLSVFMIRRVPKQFNLTKEAIYISLLYYFHSILMPFLNSECISFMPLNALFTDIRNFLILVFIIIYPEYCMIDNLHHHLPTPFILQHQKFILINPFIRKYFMHFIENRREQYLQKGLKQYKEYEYCNIYFPFLNKFELINVCQNETLTSSSVSKQQKRLQELFDKLVIDQTQCYPQYLVYQLKNQDIDAYIMQQFYEYCNQRITQYYQDYKYTKSFDKMKQQFERNERSINRLKQFKLIDRIIAL